MVILNFKNMLDAYFSDRTSWKTISITASSVLFSVWIWNLVSDHEESISCRGKKALFKVIRMLPVIKNKINGELQKIQKTFREDALERTKGTPYIVKLPEKGKSPDQIVKEVESYLHFGDFNWQEGKVSGAVYNFNPELISLLTNVYGLASYTNPLHPDVFPGICKMEAEVVRMCADLFQGGPDSCGTMTTGGTESIMMACKAYRDYARFKKGINFPEIVVPKTAHPAFDKAAAYFRMKIIHVPVDPETTKVNIRAMKSAISKRTCMLVGSAPNFPYGTMDDIEAIAKLGQKYNIPVHVDACLGGFLIPFMNAAGYSIPPHNFNVPGVTSISADTHKYGFSPKGSSVILYSDPMFRHYQYTVTTDWPGGVYGSPTVNGSRAGGIIAACWATLLFFGLDGYVSCTKKIIQTTKYIENELRKIDEIYIFGKPATSVVAIGSKVFHVYRLSDALTKRGWSLNILQYPEGIHLCVTNMHTANGVAEKFVSDVKEEVKEIMKDPSKAIEGKMAMYGNAIEIPDRSVVGDFTRYFLDSMYYTQ